MPIMPKNLMLAPLVKSLAPCINAINNADLIILGPGSFLTSVIPPLLVRDISNAIVNRKGHCVFIDNIVAEQSPAAKLSIDEKLSWLEENIGCLPIDSVICPEPYVNSDKVDIICRDLAHNKVPHHHDKQKLIAALEACISQASESKKLA
ncbi:MAG: 2-phospho-L-lactate transferase CofD family protein, partial [Colwellia sp.]|nr:2-phospho-L-lactate transferase CofD family protein [Colwellia sp.]